VPLAPPVLWMPGPCGWLPSPTFQHFQFRHLMFARQRLGGRAEAKFAEFRLTRKKKKIQWGEMPIPKPLRHWSSTSPRQVPCIPRRRSKTGGGVLGAFGVSRQKWAAPAQAKNQWGNVEHLPHFPIETLTISYFRVFAIPKCAHRAQNLDNHQGHEEH